MPNTHRAYVMVDSAVFLDKQGNKYIKEFEVPRHKLIASGNFGFCLEALIRYGDKYKLTNTKAGVVRHEEPGNPWEREWPEV